MENFEVSKYIVLLSEQISKFLKGKNFYAAIQLFRENESIELPANLLVSKAIAIQLSENSNGYSLDDARRSLLLAVSRDTNYADAWLELAYFYFAIDDDSIAALTCFEKAHFLAQKLYLNSILGKAKALSELGRTAEALTLLEQSNSMENSLEIEQLRGDLLEG